MTEPRSDEPRTAAGREAVKMRGLFGGETEERATAWVQRIEAEAADQRDQAWLHADQSAGRHDPEAVAVMRRTLETIKRDEGKVCPEYETCIHLACSSSYSSWALADAALRFLARTATDDHAE